MTDSSSPYFNRRAALLLGIAALVTIGTAAVALRPHSARTSATVTSPESRTKPIAAAAPVVANRNAQLSAPTPSSAANSAGIPSELTSEDTVRVSINIRPEGARVFYRGKEVGRTPFTLELLRGERRVFEVGYPGYRTRRLVIDGSEKEVTFSMTPDAK